MATGINAHHPSVSVACTAIVGVVALLIKFIAFENAVLGQLVARRRTWQSDVACQSLTYFSSGNVPAGYP